MQTFSTRRLFSVYRKNAWKKVRLYSNQLQGGCVDYFPTAARHGVFSSTPIRSILPGNFWKVAHDWSYINVRKKFQRSRNVLMTSLLWKQHVQQVWLQKAGCYTPLHPAWFSTQQHASSVEACVLQANGVNHRKDVFLLLFHFACADIRRYTVHDCIEKMLFLFNKDPWNSLNLSTWSSLFYYQFLSFLQIMWQHTNMAAHTGYDVKSCFFTISCF